MGAPCVTQARTGVAGQHWLQMTTPNFGLPISKPGNRRRRIRTTLFGGIALSFVVITEQPTVAPITIAETRMPTGVGFIAADLPHETGHACIRPQEARHTLRRTPDVCARA